MEKCVSVIYLQFKLLPFFSDDSILVPSNVYTSIVSPLLYLSIPSVLFIYLSWRWLPSWHISLCLQWVYMMCAAIWIEASLVTPICWSPILHLAQWISKSTFFHISKRSVVKFSMFEHTYSSERMPLIFRICILHYSISMWESIVESADLKSYRDLLHFIHRSVTKIVTKWVNHCVLVIFLDLIIFLLEIVEVIEEWENGRETLAALILFGSDNLALL